MDPPTIPFINSSVSLSNPTLTFDLDPSESSFKVYVRSRPLNQKELLSETPKKRLNIIRKHENMVFIMDPDTELDRDPSLISKKDRSYTFSDVFDETYTNEQVYNALHPIPPKVLSGVNCTIFAYGMTGCGKSHTMFGLPDQDPGLNFRLLEDLISNLKTYPFYSLKISFLEIYNEQIRDLLIPNSPNLLIYEDPIKGFLVSELTDYEVQGTEELRKYVNIGNSRRTMASTAANQFSSRSHAVLQLFIETSNKDSLTKTQSKLNMIDLAGSERASATENRGLRMKEGANINRSLLTLGACINILSDTNKKGVFVPYRDSKLTKILKDSLGGNTLTFMIACISPFAGSYDETINTLKYASRAKNITKKVNRNIIEVEINVVQYKRIVDDLRKEIKGLRQELESKHEVVKGGIHSATSYQQERLFEQIGEKIFENLQENWELSQSLNELNELQFQNQERLKSLMDRTPNFETTSLEPEIKGLNLIMENNEKVKKDLEFSLLTNQNEKRSLQDYLRNFNSIKDETHLSLETHDKKVIGPSSKRMKEMEKEMELMRRKLAEKDLLIEKNNELLKILKKNNDHSSNLSPQFYPSPHNNGIKGRGSISFYPGVQGQNPLLKSNSNFSEKRVINPIKITEAKISNDPSLLTLKLSERSSKRPDLRLNNQRLDNTFIINDTSILREGGSDDNVKKEEISLLIKEKLYNENNYSMNCGVIKTPGSGKLRTKAHQNFQIKVNDTASINNRSINTEIITPNNNNAVNKSMNTDKITPVGRRSINYDLINSNNRSMNIENVTPNDNNNNITNNDINQSLYNEMITRNNNNNISNTNNQSMNNEMITPNNNSIINKSINESPPKINISYENLNKKSQKDSPIKMAKKNTMDNINSYSNNNNNSNNANSNNGLVINVIHIKSSDTSNINNNEKISIRKKSGKDIQIKTIDFKPSEVKQLPNSVKGSGSVSNKFGRNINVNTSYDNSQKIINIPIMKANLTSKTSLNKAVSPVFAKFKPTTMSNNNKTYLSNSSMIKKDLKINIDIKSLDRARENYRSFKEKITKLQQIFSQEKMNDTMKKSIQGILIDYSQNQYMLSANDQIFIKKLQDTTNFQNKPIRIENIQIMEEKTRSNSLIMLDKRNSNKDILKNIDTKNEDEILLLLNNQKYGRLSSDRINSDHHRSSKFYQSNESALWFDKMIKKSIDTIQNDDKNKEEIEEKGCGEFYITEN